MNIYLLEKYNNYFNRKIKFADSIQEYLSGRNYDVFTVDFNPNDGVNTTQIINWNNNWIPDYLLVTSDNTIVSRWFITEAIRTRGGQYNLSLKRDVIADYKNNLLDSPAFIEKGTIRDTSNSLIYNNESVSVNQIKKGEVLLHDLTGCAWIVMYLAKETLGTDTTININLDDATDTKEVLPYPISQWEFYQYSQGNNYKVATETQIKFRGKENNNFLNQFAFAMKDNGFNSKFNEFSDTNLTYHNYYDGKTMYERFVQYMVGETRNELFLRVSNTYSYHSTTELERLLNFDGQIIKDSTGSYFYIEVVNVGNSTTTEVVASNAQPALHSLMNTAWNNISGTGAKVANNSAFRVKFSTQNYVVRITPATLELGATCNLSNTTAKTNSPLYDILCMPYGQVNISTVDSGIDITSNKTQSIAIMNSIARQLTKAKVLDMQLVPYCPIQNDVVANKQVLVFGDGSDVLEIKENNQTIAVALVARNTTFTFNIYNRLDGPNYELEDNQEAMNIKYTNDCTLVRLCSPNYNGLFDFNLAKNGMSISHYNVDCTYKPFNPYIHVTPDLTGLYGSDFDDARGLICGGDFSLGILDDAWNAYEIQNKNYQNIFDRQIQNLDFNNKITRIENNWQVASGTVQGAVSGAAAGALVGGPWGAAAGAVVGGVSSLAGGIADTMNLAARQEEARNLSIDMYNLNLGNIKALPLSVTRTSAITANNKLVPFLEIYECTRVEREAYFNKLKYDGMTIGVIDILGNWISGDATNYLKCRLIRNEEIADDTHVLDAINEELMKGVYI